jgi:hypothetical protein
MKFPSLINPVKMSPARRERFAYWRAVPLSRLYFLLLAVFFTFGTIGLLSSILSAGTTPVVVAVGWVLITGVSAICYILVLARRPALFPILVACQLAVTFAYSSFDDYAMRRHWLHPLPEHSGTAIFVVTAIIFIAAGYSFFLIFIQTEGRQTIRAHAELAMAHSIQQTLVPALSLRLAGCEIHGVSVPSDKVGGDIVDVVALPDGSVAAYVADVAGHGLQAGILMGMVKTSARTSLLDRPDPAELFASLNRVMPGVKEAHMYATCVALHIAAAEHDGSREVRFAVAGHPAILRIDGYTRKADYLSDEQLPLGLFAFATYRSQTVCCGSGDLLIVATDGVLEVERADGQEFGTTGLEALAREGMKDDLPMLAQRILNAATAFGKQTDDQTLLLIRVG